MEARQMTKEQAIEFANCLKNNYTIDFNDMADFCDMAIKSLEQQSDDCVSRQAVLDEIKSMSNANPSYWATCDVIDREDLIDNIQALPPVTPAYAKGKWIELEDFDCSDRGERLVKCSACDSCNGYDKSDYCPNCGADMGGNSDGSN